MIVTFLFLFNVLEDWETKIAVFDLWANHGLFRAEYSLLLSLINLFSDYTGRLAVPHYA